MAALDAWPGIVRHGLLSTSAILDRLGVDADTRRGLERMQRPEGVDLWHPVHGRFHLRDQKPIPEAQLRRCLSGMEPQAWYALLNRKVFFWPSEERLRTHQCALGNRDREHCVLTVGTAALLAAAGERVTLSPINSGAALRKPAARGPATFRSVSEYPYAERRRRNARGALAEVAVDYALPEIRELVLAVTIMKNGRSVRSLVLDALQGKRPTAQEGS